MKSNPFLVRSVLAVVAASLAFAGAGCYQVPVTGRHALSLVDDKEVSKMSMAAFAEMKAHQKISYDKVRNAQLQRVGERLQQAVPIWDMPDAEWEFVVFDDPAINAFAMAGGKVGVFSGLFKIAQTDDQLASVIGHEIAHVTAKHIHEQLSRDMAVNTVGGVGSMALMGTMGGSLAGSLTSQAILSVYGLGTGVSGLAFDRSKEKEADYIGLMYMARAGYDPHEAIKVLEKLEEETGAEVSNIPAWQSSHPSNPDRIRQIEEAMPKALKEQERSQLKPAVTIVK